jgi:hypothetical protein
MEVLALPYLSHLPLCPADEKVNHVGVGMQRVPVESRSLATIGYDPEPQILELEFRQTGQVYQYFDVPAQEYVAFLQAESKGTHLNQHFKPRGYRYVRVRSQAEAE